MASSRAYHALIHGDHVCRPATGLRRREAAAIDFAQQGLWAQDRVLFLADTPSPRAMQDLLIGALPDAAAAIDRRQIIILPAREIYLRDGAGFDPVAVLDGLIAYIDGAIADGYHGLRLDGDLTWLDGAAPDIAAISEYELAGNRPILTMPVLGVCHYTQQAFPPRDWARIESAHPEHLPETGTLSGIHAVWREPGVLSLSGSADLANASAFASLLDAVPKAPTLTVDGSHLEFADAHAMGRLLALASRQPTTLRLPAAIAGYMVLLGADAVRDLRVETC